LGGDKEISLERKETGILTFTNPKESIGEELLVFARITGYRDFKGPDWMLIIFLPSKAAFASALDLRNRMAFIFAINSILILIGVWYLSHRITLPVKRLGDALQKFGKGNRDVTVEVKSGDEIGCFPNHLIEWRRT